ncbi:MAG TPA: HEPN domain-containing protein [Gemmataceae bacterium]|nr:HEPN domain-containing protein [Gemmataceae bacterium]
MKRVTRQWVRKAENAVAAARQLLKCKPLLCDEICFHCQQAMEKYFKGLLAELGLPIQKTHDLIILLKQLIPADQTLAGLRVGLKGATRYAGEYRYPGLNTTSRQARAVFQRALKVRKEIRKRLGLPDKR